MGSVRFSVAGGFGANPPPGPRDRGPPPNNARNTAGAARGAPTPLADHLSLINVRWLWCPADRGSKEER